MNYPPVAHIMLALIISKDEEKADKGIEYLGQELKKW